MASYGYGMYYNDCGCCYQTPVEFQSEEGRERRRALVRHFRKWFIFCLPLAVVATLSGATTIGLAIPRPSYPFLSCFPLASGSMMLVACLAAWNVSCGSLELEVPARVKRFFFVHYGICVSACSISSMAAGFSAWGLALCLSQGADAKSKCEPALDVRSAFSVVDMAANLLLTVLAVWGLGLFCRNVRNLGLVPRHPADLQREVDSLRSQVQALTHAQGTRGGAGEAPPSYSSMESHYGLGYSQGQGYVNPAMAGYQEEKGYQEGKG